MSQTGKIIVGIVVLALVVWGIVAATKKNDSTSNNPIKIGFIAPLTGDAASFGEPIRDGVNLAEKEINDAGGINGRMIQVIYEDGQCTGEKAVSAAQKLINVDKVKFIVGGVCSGELLAFGPTAEQSKVVVISPSATNLTISQLGDYIFRNAPSDASRGAVMADYVAKSFKKVAIISEKTDYSKGIKDTFLAQAAKNNLTISVNEEFNTDVTDFRSILAKVKQGAPDVVVLNPQTPAGFVRLAQQARTIGITVPFISSEFNGPEVLTAGKDVEGAVIAVAPGLSTGDKGKNLLASYKTLFSKEASYPYYVGAAYDGVYLLADAIKVNGEDSTKVKDYLYSLKNYDGTLGTYSFDQNGDIVGINFVFEKITGGKTVPVQY